MALRSLLVLAFVGGLPALGSGETLNTLGDELPKEMTEAAQKIVSDIMPEAKDNVETVLPAIQDAFKRLSSSYQNEAMRAHAISVDKAVIDSNFKGHDSKTAIYGELTPPSVAAMLVFALKHNPNIEWDGEQDHRYELKAALGERRPKFYDLGSGFGKIAMLAAVSGFDAGGYELAEPRIQAACQALDRLAGQATMANATSHEAHSAEMARDAVADAAVAAAEPPPRQECGTENGAGHGELRFFKGSFTHEDVDLKDADIIFTDSVFWTKEMMETLAGKAKHMKDGSLIFSYKPFPGDTFTDLKTLSLPTSWSSSTDWHVQQVQHTKQVKTKLTGNVLAQQLETKHTGSLRGSS